MNKPKKISIKDIAREAGVSVTTASFYLNGKAEKYKIAKKTCEKIEAVVRKYNYSPNIHARAIQTNRTFLLGLIVPGSVNRSFWIDIISGIEEVISKHKYHLLLSISHFNQEEELEAFKFMRSKGVDGYIFCPVFNGSNYNYEYITSLAKEKPVVSITFPYDGLTSIYNDNSLGGKRVAEYLYEKGHRKVAYIGHLDKGFDFRGKAFVEYNRKHGIETGVYSDTDSFFKDIKKYTAVFCYSDYFVLDLYGKALANNISIPENISIVGYDNMSFIESLHPKPTSVHQSKKKLGNAAGEFLMDILVNKAAYKSKIIKFEPEVIERESVLCIK